MTGGYRVEQPHFFIQGRVEVSHGEDLPVQGLSSVRFDRHYIVVTLFDCGIVPFPVFIADAVIGCRMRGVSF